MASTYLTRTFGSAGNRQSWTWSAWIKKTKVYNSTDTGDRVVWFGGYTASNNTDWLEFGTQGDAFYFTTSATTSSGNRLMRDPNGWFHAVVTYDGSNLKFYHNNELDFNNTQLGGNRGINVAGVHTIGAVATNQGSRRFDGLMSHVHFVDGAVLAPTVFGETDSTTGEWKIIPEPTVSSYGTNGFFILKDGNSVTDQSGNGNNWTVAGGTLTKTEDNPSNVFATLNPLYHYLDSATLSNGNTAFACGSSPKGRGMATIRPSAGKYYAEYKITNSSRFQIGIMNGSETNSQQGGADTNSVIVGYSGSCYFNDSSFNSYCGSFSDNDIVMIAIDCDNKLAWLGKNGTWFQSATTTEIQNGTATNSLTTFISSQNPMSDTVGIFAENNSGSGSHDGLFNFGNGYFGTTAVSSAGTNASGNGIFEYDVPAGYTALSTKGLNL